MHRYSAMPYKHTGTLIIFYKIGNAVLLLLGAVWLLISKDWYLIAQYFAVTYIIACLDIKCPSRKKKNINEKVQVKDR